MSPYVIQQASNEQVTHKTTAMRNNTNSKWLYHCHRQGWPL